MCLKQCPRLPFQKLVFVILSLCRIALNIQCDNKVNRFMHMHVNVCVRLDIFSALYCNNKSNYEALFCLWNFTRLPFYVYLIHCLLLYVLFYLCEKFNSIHFHFVLSFHLIFFSCFVSILHFRWFTMITIKQLWIVSATRNLYLDFSTEPYRTDSVEQKN